MLHNTPNMITDIYNGLSDEQIMHAVPSVFAEEAHTSRSSRYMFLPTSSILAGMRDEGYVPTQVVRQQSRVEGQESHGKHFLRFRHVNDLHTSLPEVHEIGVLNSHNGASGLRAMAGIIRFVCENGCIFGDFNTNVRVQHRGNKDMLDAILNAVFQIAANSVHVMEEVANMKQILLNHEEQLLLAEYAMTARFDNVKIVESGEIDRSLVAFQPQDFLRVPYSRPHDYPTDYAGNRSVYDTYQLLEENLIERPVRSSQRNRSGMRSHTRALNGIDGNIKVQTTLWAITKRMADIKTGAYQG